MSDCLELFSIPCPLHLLHPKISSLVTQEKLVHQNIVGHRSKYFAFNVVFTILRLERFHSLPCGFMIPLYNHKSFWASFGMLARAFLLHGMAAAIGLSNFPLVFCRVWAPSFSIQDSERLHQLSSILLATRDLVWWSFELLSISPGPHISFWRLSFSGVAPFLCQERQFLFSEVRDGSPVADA